MKVVINGTVHDARDEPILLILDDDDKSNIAQMTETAHNYMAYPDTLSEEDARDIMRRWMGIDV